MEHDISMHFEKKQIEFFNKDADVCTHDTVTIGFQHGHVFHNLCIVSHLYKRNTI